MKAILSANLIYSSVKVKLLSKFWDKPYGRYLYVCRITSRKHLYYKCGEIVHATEDEIFLKEGIISGGGGKLYWQGKPDFSKLSVAYSE